MSMTWMSMGGQQWLRAAATFLGMWMLMMVAMMLPSLVPTLLSHRRAARNAGVNRIWLITAAIGISYFLAWGVFGAVAYSLGGAITSAEMRWPELARSVPWTTGVVLLLAGLLQFTAWKTAQLRCCRAETALKRQPQSGWRCGLLLGVRCTLCCCGFMAVLLALGVMNLAAMAILAVAVAAERIAPRPRLAARVIGGALITVGAFIVTKAALTI
jgi:predicted metal-binding membrane protein